MKKRFVLLVALLLAMSMTLVACDDMTSGGLIKKLIEQIWGDPDNVPGDISQMLESIPPDLTLPEDITLPDNPTWGSTDEPNPPDPDPIYSEGLIFSSNGDGTCAVGSGKCTDTDVVIPELSPSGERVISIYAGSFNNHPMRSITIPSSVTRIDESAIIYCGNLESVTVSKGNTKYHSENNCIIETETNTLVFGCKTATIPDGVKHIGTHAFFYCEGLRSITIPDSVISIGWGAFADCTGLTTITIPESVTSIDSGAFSGCFGLESIAIPYSVTQIGCDSFSGCMNLTSITVAEENPKYMSVGNCIIEKESNILVAGCKTSKIPDGITQIGDRAFFCMYDMTSIVIPNSVTGIGSQAFDGCNSLTDVYFTGTEQEWTAIAGVADELLTATIHFNYVPEE